MRSAALGLVLLAVGLAALGVVAIAGIGTECSLVVAGQEPPTPMTCERFLRPWSYVVGGLAAPTAALGLALVVARRA